MSPFDSTTHNGFDVKVIRECSSASFHIDMPFSEVVLLLERAGVDRYHTDLILQTKTYFGRAGESHTEPFPDFKATKAAETFCDPEVKAALNAIQQKQIGYCEFLSRIMAAGTVSYDVFITGRKAIYLGRGGDFHVEEFPRPGGGTSVAAETIRDGQECQRR